jgi:hypothetical protein
VLGGPPCPLGTPHVMGLYIVSTFSRFCVICPTSFASPKGCRSPGGGKVGWSYCWVVLGWLWVVGFGRVSGQFVHSDTHPCMYLLSSFTTNRKRRSNSFFISLFLHFFNIHFYISLFFLILKSCQILRESSTSGISFTTLDDIATSYVLLKTITFDMGNLLGRLFNEP